MNSVEYVSIIIAVAIMAVRIILIFPRQEKSDDTANA